MPYRKWMESHYQKHRKIVEKLQDLSDDEVIEYFSFSNMREKEPGFCPLYEKNKPCHDMKDLSCYMCGCPNFRFLGRETSCAIKEIDCLHCDIPHHKKFIKKNFKRDWKEMMSECKVNKLYMVSLGAGDYELATIKALKTLEKSEVICIPTKDEKGSFKKSLTFKIVQDLMREFNFQKPLVPVYAPMKFQEKDWENQVNIIMSQLAKHQTVSFVTLGDAGVYSTIYYLLERIKKRDERIYDNCEVIAGITSFSYASSRVKKPLCLGESRLEIIPLVSPDAPKTKVYMRPKKGMNTDEIEENGELYTFEDLNFETENITKGKKEKLERYMTLLIDFIKGKND